MGADTATLPERIADRYRVEGFLGEGGMGCVLRAIHAELGQPVAIKLVRPGLHSGRALERMRREAVMLARLRGPHVVRVIDSGEDRAAGRFIVMELVEGRTLKELIGEGPCPPARAIELALQAAEGVGEAHALGIVHRDIKPSNLLLSREPSGAETIRVTDFGIAKSDAADTQTLTDSAAVLGSPKYMSPEQLRDARAVDARTDVWSIGVVLYELVSARLPYEAFTTAGLLARVAADPPVPLRERDAGIPEALERVVMRCLARDPAARFQSMSELSAALREARAELSMPSQPALPAAEHTLTATSHGAPGPSPRRRLALTVALGLVATCAVAVALFATTRGRGDAPVALGAAPSVAAQAPEGPRVLEAATAPVLAAKESANAAVASASATAAATTVAVTAAATTTIVTTATTIPRAPTRGSGAPPKVVAAPAPAPPPSTTSSFVDFGPRR